MTNTQAAATDNSKLMASTGYHYDLYVIGAGSGGVRAARRAAEGGMKVAIAEEQHYGGTCVNVGCIPKKLFSYAAQYAERLAESAAYGFTVKDASFHWPSLRAAKDRAIARLNTLYRERLRDAGVALHDGRAVFAGPHEIKVGPKVYKARHILIATGGSPHRPPLAGAEHAVMSDDMFTLPSLPKRMAVIGGGYISVEFASILNALGVEVVIVHRGAQLLTGFDHELCAKLKEAFEALGLEVRLNAPVSAIERLPPDKGEPQFNVAIAGKAPLRANLVLAATGRRPRTEHLNVECAGIKMAADGTVRVDASFRSSVPHIFAIGDVIDRLHLTPVAISQAEAVVAMLLSGDRKIAFDDACTPTAVFSHPPLASVGLSEAAARRAGEEAHIARSSFIPLRAALFNPAEVSGKAYKSFIKAVIGGRSGKLLGLHMVGEDAPEIIQGFASAMKAGILWSELRATLGIHPTSAEEIVTLG